MNNLEPLLWSFAEKSPDFLASLNLPPETIRILFFGENVSAEAIDVLTQLEADGKIRFKPTVPLTYMADGEILRLPIAKGLKEYKSPHWLPVVLNIAT